MLIVKKTFYVLVVSGLMRMSLLLMAQLPYWYDELIFISFSKQPLVQLLDTLSSEPHPPGFFLLLKLLPVENVLVTRLLMLGISYALFGIGVMYAYKTRLIERAKLTWGLTLFFTSYSFYSATMYVRDRSTSIPLAFIGLMIALNMLDAPKKYARVKHVAGLGIIGVLLLFLSYDIFLFYLLAIILLTLYIRNRSLIILNGCIGIVGLLYSAMYGIGQIGGNAGRSIWFSYVYNSLWHAFYKHVAGVLPFQFMTDAAVGIYSILMGYAMFKWREVNRSVGIGVGAFLILSIGIAYATNLFSRAHYVALLFLPVCIIAGWGMEYIKRAQMKYVLVTIVAIVGFGAYLFDYMRARQLYTILPDTIAKELVHRPEKQYGLIADAPLMPFVIKMGYFSDEDNVRPMQIVSDDVLETDEITRYHLQTDTALDWTKLTKDMIRSRLNRYGHEHIIYYYSPFTQTYQTDIAHTLLRILITSCTEHAPVPISEHQLIFIFHGCTFTDTIRSFEAGESL